LIKLIGRWIDNLPQAYWAFLVSSIVIILIPGPSVLFVMSRGIALGKNSAIATAFGNSLGTFVNVLVLAVGLGPIIEQYPVVLMIIRYLGAAYLVYLGIETIRTRRKVALNVLNEEDQGLLKVIRQGAIVGITNPKTIVFFAAVLPQFVVTKYGYLWLQLLLLGLVFCILGFSFDSGYGLAAGLLRDWFTREPKRLAQLSATGGSMIVALGIAVVMGWF